MNYDLPIGYPENLNSTSYEYSFEELNPVESPLVEHLDPSIISLAWYATNPSKESIRKFKNTFVEQLDYSI